MKAKRVPYNKIQWTPEMIKWMKDNFDQFENNRQMYLGFIDKFDIELKRTSFRTKLYKMNLYRQHLEYWPKEAFQFLKENYHYMGNHEMAELFDQWWPKQKGWTWKHIDKKMLQNGIKRKPEHLEAIRQRNIDRGIYREGSKKTWDTIGRTPVGTIKVWYMNSTKRKYIKTESGFEPLARNVYRKHHGNIPEGHNVFHLDNDQMNCHIDNLILVKNCEQAYMTHYLPALRITALKLGRLKQKLS